MSIQNTQAAIELGTLTAGTRWLALFETTPNETSAGTEISTSGTGYARVQVDAGDWTIVDKTATLNTEKAFPTAVSAWPTVVGFALMTASSAGTILRYEDLFASKAILLDDTARFASGELTLNFS